MLPIQWLENHYVRVTMPRMQREGLLLFGILKIIPIARCVPWPGIAESEF